MNPPLPSPAIDSEDGQTVAAAEPVSAATEARSGMWQCPYCGDTFDLEDNSGQCDCRYD